MTEPHYELNYIQAGLEELEAYLLSKELFWPVATPPQLRSFPKLTLGNLLLSINKLKGCSSGRLLSPAQNTAFAQSEREVQAFRRKWAVAWKTKAAREYQSRLRQWIHYLNELNKNKDAHAPYYSSEVRIRVLLELLSEYALPNAEPDLSQIDRVFRAKLHPAEFIWDADIQPAFPPEEFWFLYGAIGE